MSENPIVEVRNLSKHFGRIEAVRDVSLEVQRGEVVVIIGPSGSGKSTLLRCINQLEVPNAGYVAVDGVALKSGGEQSTRCAPRWAWSSSSSTSSRT